ncbi:hypothetical protein [Natrinema amylolyticum]|uniref:hypothetical protein n=1 Tax=Natrinema amylolyticum TaxID=2878679 RepID=UPI001CF9E18D|nr:hypothetical protein [Natrinema amylolyticum]
MHRRAVLGTLAAGCGTLFAGCSESRVNGVVVSNETSLVFSHEYSTQATYSGTQVVVDVTAENEGVEPITPEVPVPQVVCTFLDNGGETLHQSGLKLKEFIGVEETITLEFTLAVDVDDVTHYELRSEWVEE